MLILRSSSVTETQEIAAALSRLVAVNDIIVLSGDMGAGKTAFAQGFGIGLGVDEPVTSPTFNLVHTYDSGRLIMHHADLYRLDRTSEISDLALGELVEGDGVLLVEWGEAAAGMLGDHLEIRFDTVGSDGNAVDVRIVTLVPCGEAWTRRWPKIEAGLAPWVVGRDEADLGRRTGEPC